MSDQNTFRLLAAELRTDLPTLDLHGVFPNEAVEKIDPFLYYNFQAQESAVKIVYGAGTGKLRQAVVDYLQSHPLVGTLRAEGAYCLVLIF
jgi:DNA-nicking Smr family endonuclease